MEVFSDWGNIPFNRDSFINATYLTPIAGSASYIMSIEILFGDDSFYAHCIPL